MSNIKPLEDVLFYVRSVELSKMMRYQLEKVITTLIREEVRNEAEMKWRKAHPDQNEAYIVNHAKD